VNTNHGITLFKALSLGLGLPFELMRFTLTFDGLLPSAGKANSRLPEKWAIRNHLHPQLAELWDTHPILFGYSKSELLGQALAELSRLRAGIQNVITAHRRLDLIRCPLRF
jgi:hypothetical protein